MTTFRDLDAWRQSMEMAEVAYQLTERFPASERFGISSQLRRAAVSITSNIAEGHCRRTTRAYINHVSIALGSHGELSTLIELSTRLGYLTREDCRRLHSLNEHVGRLLYGLHRALSAKADVQP